MFKVIVHGLTNLEDVKLAIDCGADAIAFEFNPKNPRFIQMRVVREIISKLEKHDITYYATFSDEKEFIIDKVMKDSHCGKMIFSGNEESIFCKKYIGNYMKRINLSTQNNVNFVSAYTCEEFILDIKFVYDLSKAHKVAQIADVYLGGLIQEENIAMIAEKIMPKGFVLSENIEEREGLIDKEKLIRMILLIKSLKFDETQLGIMQ